MVNTNYLSLTWSTSRGRDTYGYNIARLDARDTDRRYKCMGGGYDMVGTVFGQWLEDVYQSRLVELAQADRFAARYTKSAGYQSTNEMSSRLYGGCFHQDENRVSLDGACGLETMVRIAEQIGISVSRTYNRKGHTTGFMITEYADRAAMIAARGE
ncbi:MAG: hypothetical protein ACRD63_17615 [Pyrinomonadaceae bacterium]